MTALLAMVSDECLTLRDQLKKASGSMRNSTPYAITLIGLSVLGCSRKPEENKTQPVASPSVPAAVAASASVAPAESAAAAPHVIPDQTPVCSVQSKKVWVKGANKLTGLTEAMLPDGRAAIGFAIGNQPQVLLVSAAAKGAVVKVPIAKTARLATVPKGATRYLLRVTPVKANGDAVQAFVDFEDQYKDKKRTIACGPADTIDNWVEFDGMPCNPPKDAKPDQLAALFPQVGAEKVCDEVRTCRSFTNLDRGETWVISSDVHGVLQADNSVIWRSDLTVATGSKTQKRVLESSPVKDKTIADEYYEVPVSHAMKSGSYLVAARQHNHLVVGLLGPDKSLLGKFSRYPGFPTLPDMADDGGDALVLATAFAKAKGEFGLRALRIHENNPTLPKGLEVVVTDKGGADAASESDPDFLHDAQGRRWLAHIEGPRGDGVLSLAPINEHFKAIGRSYQVTEAGERAVAARLIPLKDKGILVVFLREVDKVVELVSEEVHCKVE